MMPLHAGLAIAALALGVAGQPIVSDLESEGASQEAVEASLHTWNVEVPVSPNSPDRRSLDVASTVRPEHAHESPLFGVDSVEWQARTEAAALHRLLFLHGMGP